jgi:hypothetical protein
VSDGFLLNVGYQRGVDFGCQGTRAFVPPSLDSVLWRFFTFTSTENLPSQQAEDGTLADYGLDNYPVLLPYLSFRYFLELMGNL